jgi:hypothetical protein
MPEEMHARTDLVRQFADRLDPAPAADARAAAEQARAAAGTCADPTPGCLRLTQTLTGVAERIGAFCAEVEQGIQAYATVARDSAAIYTQAGHAGATAVGRAVADF